MYLSDFYLLSCLLFCLSFFSQNKQLQVAFKLPSGATERARERTRLQNREQVKLSLKRACRGKKELSQNLVKNG